MSRQLPADCLCEVFEYFEQDKIALHSCLLVNRLWCETGVRILWKNIWKLPYEKPYKPRVSLAIIRTLVTCLPQESKDLLYKSDRNGFFSFFYVAPTLKPLFNYASFCKVLSIHVINAMIKICIKEPKLRFLLFQEILKMYMNQISSLKGLNYYSGYSSDIIFTYFPGANNCLMELTELDCTSDIYPEFFYRISQICRNIQSLIIRFNRMISDGLADFISLQSNLKGITLQSTHQSLLTYEVNSVTSDISTSDISLSLTKLTIRQLYMPLSFIEIFTNLQELILSFDYDNGSDYFFQLQNTTFPQLKVLKFLNKFPEVHTLITFLNNNGENLNELYIWDNNNSLNLAIAKFCPNLKILFTIFIDGEVETLKEILISCQNLERINFWCDVGYLSEQEFLEALSEYSPEHFDKLELYYIYNQSEILPSELKKSFKNWNDRQRKPLSLTIIINDDLEINEEIMKIIESYIKEGFIKKFVIKKYEEEI